MLVTKNDLHASGVYPHDWAYTIYTSQLLRGDTSPSLYIWTLQFSLETYISHIIVQKQVHRTCLHGIATDNYENFVITKFVEHHTDNQAELCFLPPYILEMYYVIIRPKLCDYHDSGH
jgi:hypothetical protein